MAGGRPMAALEVSDAEPLQNGRVSFLPADGKGGGTTTMVQNGEFECGVAPGEKVVAIHDVQKMRSHENPSSPLKAVVKPGTENRFDFNVSSRSQ